MRSAVAFAFRRSHVPARHLVADSAIIRIMLRCASAFAKIFAASNRTGPAASHGHAKHNNAGRRAATDRLLFDASWAHPWRRRVRSGRVRGEQAQVRTVAQSVPWSACVRRLTSFG